MGDLLSLIEAHHAGIALDRMGIPEKRVERVLLRLGGLDRQQRRYDPVETLVRLVAEDLEQLYVDGHHARICAAESKAARSIIPTSVSSTRAAPCSRGVSAFSVSAGASPTSSTSSTASPERLPASSMTTMRPAPIPSPTPNR